MLKSKIESAEVKTVNVFKDYVKTIDERVSEIEKKIERIGEYFGKFIMEKQK